MQNVPFEIPTLTEFRLNKNGQESMKYWENVE